VKSINDFAGNADFIGGKTGYTDQADGNLLSIFEYGGRPIFIMVLGINDGVRFNATQQLYDWFKTNF
jgi:D-alanyl-D-alanine carboxypeptidase